MLCLFIVFLAGWFTAVLIEYGMHWLLHHFKAMIHSSHHRDVFKMSPQEVARYSRCLRVDARHATYAFLLFLPLALIWGMYSMVPFYVGIFWHLVFVYPMVHAALHYDKMVPGTIRETRWFRWWRRCHLAHHIHAPHSNYSVTFPPLDILLRTYVRPRDSYPDDPSKLRRKHRK